MSHQRNFDLNTRMRANMTFSGQISSDVMRLSRAIVHSSHYTNNTIDWSFSSTPEHSGDTHLVRLVEIECSEYVRLVLSERSEALSHWPRSATEIWSRDTRVSSVCNKGCSDVYPLPASDFSGKWLHVRLGHAFSGSDQEQAPHCCNPSQSTVMLSWMYHKKKCRLSIREYCTCSDSTCSLLSHVGWCSFHETAICWRPSKQLLLQ